MSSTEGAVASSSTGLLGNGVRDPVEEVSANISPGFDYLGRAVFDLAALYAKKHKRPFRGKPGRNDEEEEADDIEDEAEEEEGEKDTGGKKARKTGGRGQ